MPAPPNATCSSATVIGALPYTITGVDTTGASTDPGYVGPGTGHKAVWWRFTYSGTAPQLVTISNAGTNYFTGITVFSGACGSLTQVIFSLDTFGGPFPDNGAYCSFIAQPNTTYTFICDDEDVNAGGSLSLAVALYPIPVGSLIAAFLLSGDASVSLEALSATGVSLGLGDNSINNLSPTHVQDLNAGLVQRPSDLHFLAFTSESTVIVDVAPTFGFLAQTAPPNPGSGATPQGLAFDPAGNLYLTWMGGPAGVYLAPHHQLAKVNPTAPFTNIQTWSDFCSDIINGLTGNAIQPGEFSPNGTLFYFSAFGGSALNQNRIYALTLSNSTVNVFATYGTWSGGGNPTGNFTEAYRIRVTTSGQVVVAFTHVTAGLADSATLVIFNADGTQANAWSIPFGVGGLTPGVYSVALAPDQLSAWVAILAKDGVRFVQIRLADGFVLNNVLHANQSTGSFNQYSALLVSAAPAPPPPPPVPQVAQTIVFDLKASRSWFDSYTPNVIMRTEEEGSGVHDHILGNGDGSVSQYGGTHGDQGNPLLWRFQPGDVDGGDPRRVKAFGDLILKADPQLSTGINVTPVYNDATVSLPNQVLGTGLTGEQPFIVDINSGLAQLARNFSIQVSGSDTVQPIFYLWEPSLVPKDVLTALRATDWEDAGYPGAKWIQGLLISCDCGGVTRSAKVEYDNGNFTETFTLADSLESMIPYSFLNPVIGHLVRLVLVDPGTWILYRLRWVVEPIPEAVSTWAPQPTTHDLPGFMQCERVLLPYMSNAPATLSVSADGVTTTYAVPSSAGVFTKLNILLAPNKGKTFTWKLSTNDGSSNLRVFQKDLEVRIRAWGAQSGYGVVRPFGDISRENGGARI